MAGNGDANPWKERTTLIRPPHRSCVCPRERLETEARVADGDIWKLSLTATRKNFIMYSDSYQGLPIEEHRVRTLCQFGMTI